MGLDKPSVLVMTEYSQLGTGYSRVGHGLLNELYRSNKYRVIEFAAYCSRDDNRASSVPWEIFPVIPSKRDEHLTNIYNSHPANAFGRASINEALLKYKVTHLINFFDPWGADFLYKEPSYLKHVNLVYCPTCDSTGNKPEWLDFAKQADKLLTYTDWSKEVYEEEGRLKVEAEMAPPSTEVFSPKNKAACKKMLGLDGKTKVVSMVARNQLRKQYPELIYAFRDFLEESGRNDIVLHIHSNWPDNNGWDFPRIITESGMGSKVFFTYKCGCGNLFLSNFHGQSSFCSKCGSLAGLSNVSGFISDSEMDIIYNATDLHVLNTSLEGFGVPVLNAASVGTTVAATRYSATESTIKKLGGYFIELDSAREEIESGRKMALPSIESLKKILHDFFSLPDQIQALKGIETREEYINNYSWEKTGKAWMDAIDSLPNKTGLSAGWNSPPDIQYPDEYKELNVPNYQYAKWLISNVMKCPDRLNTFYELNLIEKLDMGVNDGRNRIPYDRRMAYNEHANFRLRLNQLEQERVNYEKN